MHGHYVLQFVTELEAYNNANAIPTRTQYVSTYASVIAGWEGLGGQGMGCKWLAGLVSRAYLYVDCTSGRGWVANVSNIIGFVYK